jgi:acetyl esterase
MTLDHDSASTNGMVGRTYLERGLPVKVLVRWNGKGPRNVLIKRESGELVVRPFRGLRKVRGNAS